MLFAGAMSRSAAAIEKSEKEGMWNCIGGSAYITARNLV
jgi:hypothetical protein